ncbi:MAG: malate dehydrogenase [Methanobacteriaceae archaeon]|nr:malate dehydrogenase [Methanobacteriaceae archaeon]OPY23666.1 MAG: Malate dehydrogenase [Methanobacterium sp. PtaU1.Bin097]
MKVSVIGASGRVGRTAAFCLAEENMVSKLVLFAREESLEKIEGESLDMYDAMAAKEIRIKILSSCEMENLHDSDIVVITAGVPRTAGMSRSDIAIPNAKIVAEYARLVAEYSPNSIILVVTNPVDVMTYVALKASGFDRNKVFGLGNHLDSLRLRNMLAKHFNIHVSEVHTRVIGEHGDHMVPLVSSTSIGGILIKNYALDGTIDVEGMVKKVINAGSYVIDKKGSTEFGPAYAIANIISTILNDDKKILTVSAYLDGEIEDIKDVCLGVPVKLGINGIERIIPIKMSQNEIDAFKKAAKFVKKETDAVIKSLE